VTPFDWWFRNRRTGAITIGQSPNLPMGVVLAAIGARWIVASGSDARVVVDGVGTAALAWWALDEVVRGVNPWRRCLGAGGCVLVAARLTALLR